MLPHPLHLTTIFLKAYLLQLLLPSASYPPYNLKLQCIIKGKNQYAETEQVLESESGMQECWTYPTKNF